MKKWSPTLHCISAISGIAGALILVGWWISLAVSKGFSISTIFSPEHMYNDAVVLLLLSIAFGIGPRIHQHEEDKHN